MQDSFYRKSEIKRLGFKSIGENVKISRFARFYGIERISIGNNVRIDDFCILSGEIELRNNIHISAYCALYGAGGIILNDYSGLSPKCVLLSATDDFSGKFLIGPQNLPDHTNVIIGRVLIEKYCQLGTNTIVLPNVTIEEGSVTGAMSLVKKSLPAWKIYGGNPLKYIRERERDLLRLIDKSTNE